MQMVIAEEAVKKGLDKTPEVTEKLEVIKQSILANAYVQDYIKNNPVTEEAMKAEYERIKATITGTEYKARHILVEKEAEAKDIIAKLKKDASAFAKLAMEKSKDTGSKVRGGDLGWFDVSRMVPEFGAAVSKLEKGAITQEPVKTQFGYHVIQLEDSRPVEAPPFDEVKPHPVAATGAAEPEEAARRPEGQGQDRDCRRAGGSTRSGGLCAGNGCTSTRSGIRTCRSTGTSR